MDAILACPVDARVPQSTLYQRSSLEMLMQRINRLFYQNDAHGFQDEEIKRFFPECGYLIEDIRPLNPGVELWIDFEVPLRSAEHEPAKKFLRGYLRAKLTGYTTKKGSLCVQYATVHYGNGSRWILGISQIPRVFRLDESHEGRLNALADRHALAQLPMLSH